MAFTTEDIVPLGQVRARLSELAEQARSGREKIITRNGESYVALIDARSLDRYHRLEQEHRHLVLLAEADRAWDDVEASRTMTVDQLRKRYGSRGSIDD